MTTHDFHNKGTLMGIGCAHNCVNSFNNSTKKKLLVSNFFYIKTHALFRVYLMNLFIDNSFNTL